MNLSVAAQCPFGDKDAFRDFLGQHEIAHTGIAKTMLSAGLIARSGPLDTEPAPENDWMMDHYAIHTQIGLGLGLAVPDLSSYDLSNQTQYEDWMEIHSLVHRQINSALRIVS